jgi:hypothetical protein
MALAPPVSPASTPRERDPVLAALERIDRRLERVEAKLAAAEETARSAPGYAAIVADSLDDLTAHWQSRGIDVDARLRSLASLVERLSDPQVAASMEKTVALATSLPQGLAAAVDTFDHWVGVSQRHGIDLDERLQTLVGVAERLTAPEALTAVRTLLGHLDALQAVLASDALSPSAIQLVVATAAGVAQSAEQPPAPVGPFGALLALHDPDVQRALGLAVALARHVGHSLASPATPSLPPAKGARS